VKQKIVRVRAKSVENFKAKVRGITQRSHNLEAEVIVRLNRVIRGTANYFATPWSHCGDGYRSLDRWIRMRLRSMKYKRKSPKDNTRFRLKYFTRMGLLSLSDLRAARIAGSLRSPTGAISAGPPGAGNPHSLTRLLVHARAPHLRFGLRLITISDKKYDCVVCGSCVLDILVRPVPLGTAIGPDTLVRTQPIQASAGGMVSNAGIALARLGAKTAALTYLGNDAWGPLIRHQNDREGVDTTPLVVHPTVGTSVSVVVIDDAGQRSFLHCQGAAKMMDRRFLLDRLDLFAQSRYALFGYYPLMPHLLDDLPEVFEAIRSVDCQTALDASSDEGTMSPLECILPQTDIYLPNRREAACQTGESNPRAMIEKFRACGAPGLLGIKLGDEGALMSPRHDDFFHVEPVSPPGDVVDSTGAGDCFLAALIAGRCNGLSVQDAAKIAAAAGACSVTAMGGATGIKSWQETAELAGVGCL